MLTASLEGSSPWTHPITASLEGSSPWTLPELVASLEGSSGWGTELRASLSGETSWLTKAAADYRGTGGQYTRPAGVSAVSNRIKPLPIVTVKLGSEVIPVLRGSIRLTRNTPIEWQIELSHDDTYDPTHAIATACRTKSATWSITFTLGEEKFAFTKLVSDDYSVDDEGNVTITGTDISERLNHDGHLPDIDCTDFATVAEDFFTNWGAKVVSEGYNPKLDYDHRIGRPIEWIGRWCGPLADWQVENGIIRVRPVEYGKPARWSFIEREDLEVLDYQATPWAIRNKARVVKEVGGQGLLLEVNESAESQFEGGFFGAKGPYQFPYPVQLVQTVVLKAERGSVNTFSFLGGAGQGVSDSSGTDGQFQSIVPITGVRFNYTPADPEVFTRGLFQPHIHVLFFGISSDRAQCNGGAGGKWEKTQAVTGGIVQAYDAPFTYQHFTAEVGQQLADALAYEGALKGETVNWQTELAPWVRPGYNVKLTERKITGYSGKTVFLQSLEHRWDHSVDEKSNEIVDSGTTSFDGSALLS